MAFTTTIVTSNIRSNPIQHYVPVRNRIRRAAGLGQINIGQEIAPEKHTRAVRKSGRKSMMAIWTSQMTAHGKKTFGTGGEIPISIPEHWPVDRSVVHFVHKGIHKVTPNRYINELRVSPYGLKICILAGHPVSKGYYPAGRRGIKGLADRRKFLAEYEADWDRLADAAVADGYTVLGGGDMNHPSFPFPGAHQLAHSRLDHLWVRLAKGAHLAHASAHYISRNVAMDHPILYATVTLDN